MRLHARRVTSALCALAMLATMLPFAAWAEDSTTESISTSTEIVETANEDAAITSQQGDAEGTQQGDAEGTQQGDAEGTQQGDAEGTQQGDVEGTQQGDAEGTRQSDAEGTRQGDAEDTLQGDTENAQQGSAANSEPGTPVVGGDNVTILEEYTITDGMNTNDIKAVLSKAKADNQPAKICAGSYDGGFTVEDITLWVEGEVNLAQSISLKNATLRGVTDRDTDKVLIKNATSEVTVSGATTLQNVTLEISGSVHNYLLYWVNGNFVVNDACLSASDNTKGCGLFVGGGTAGSKFTATNSVIHFDHNVQEQGGAGIWSNSDGNANVVFEFTGCCVTMNNNGLNGFLGQPASLFDDNIPMPRFTFTNTNVEVNGNGSPIDGGEGDGFSYGYITLKNTDGGDYTFSICNNDNNGLDGGRKNNAALNAQGYTILANNNGNIGINVSRLNDGESACVLTDCKVEANENGSYGIQLNQPTQITGTSITANKNGNSGLRFFASSYDLTADEASTLTVLENKKSGLYFYGANATLNGVFTAQNNQDSGLYIARGAVAINNGGSAITNNSSSQYGGGIRNAGSSSATSVILADGVRLYNNHAGKAGDDLYNAQKATATLYRVGTDWVLDDCGDAIDGWYDDSENTRWSTHDKTAYHADLFKDFSKGVANITGSRALKAAHAETATLQPADITIYMGGTDGYEGVADDSGDIILSNNSLPEPGYYITLPDKINQELEDLGYTVTTGDGTQPSDLSALITIRTVGADEEHLWTLHKYGNTYSAARGKYIYAVAPKEGSGTDPFRLNFIDENNHIIDQDNFKPSEEETLQARYQMDIYSELVNARQVFLEVKLSDTQTYYCTMNTEPGYLNVRYVTGSQESVVTPTYTDIVQASEEDNPDKTALDKAYVIKAPGTKFYINNSDIDVTEGGEFAQVSLLFDDIVSSTNTEGVEDYKQLLTNKAVQTVAGDLVNVKSQAKYLDLVDANNGNTWLTPNQPVTVYWPYPEGTDASTDFRLVHFEGLDRDMTTDEVTGQIDSTLATTVKLEKDAYGISFTTQKFSPFVLVWGDEPAEETEDGQPTQTPAPTAAPKVSPTPAPVAAVIPQTGDESQPLAWVTLVVLSGAALVGLTVYRKKRSDK